MKLLPSMCKVRPETPIRDRPLRVAMLAPICWRVPPRHYGPWEKSVSWLTEGLVHCGLDATLFGTADSITDARLLSICPRSHSDRSIRPLTNGTLVRGARMVLRRRGVLALPSTAIATSQPTQPKFSWIDMDADAKEFYLNPKGNLERLHRSFVREYGSGDINNAVPNAGSSEFSREDRKTI